MSIGSWNPDTGSTTDPIQLSASLLQRFISYSCDNQLQQLEQLISSDERQTLAALMKMDHRAWQSAAEPLSEDDLLHLIRFFAVAENLPGWEAGANSPVIPLAKILRKRGIRLDKALLQWLREVNDNRFLPYGPL
jgi:hypothetical protein